jgi:hypothetical protein
VEIRICAAAEVRKGCSMSKAPDLSAFPIPRKGGARPIDVDEVALPAAPKALEGGERAETADPPHMLTVVPARAPAPATPKRPSAQKLAAERVPEPASSGQTVATTVKLDENRYLRLAEAGKPGPGHLKRRTIQEMVIEALDEWFERRGL